MINESILNSEIWQNRLISQLTHRCTVVQREGSGKIPYNSSFSTKSTVLTTKSFSSFSKSIFRLGTVVPRKIYRNRQVKKSRPARLAQSVEHQTFNLRVMGSSPISGGLQPFLFPPQHDSTQKFKSGVAVRSMLQRLKEHGVNIQLAHTTSAVSEHAMN